jgi:ribonuclease HI
MAREQRRKRRSRRAGRARSDAERRRLAQASRERALAERSDRPVLWCDGGARGNPGPCAYAYVVEGADRSVLAEAGKPCGVGTATTAEYHGVVADLAHRAQDLAAAVGPVRWRWVRGEENARANALVTRALGIE